MTAAPYLIPAGTINNRTAYFYADSTNAFGPLVKTINDQVLIIIDYTTVLAGHVISTFNFTSDAETNPNLVLSDPLLNATGNVLSFLISGGIDGQQYNVTIATEQVGSTTPRDDVLTINMPSKSPCDAILPPLVSLLSSNNYSSTNIQYFWGPNPPTNAHVLDQWFNTTSNILYEWATDGINFFWEEIGISGTSPPLADAPSNNILYERENGAWVADPIQTDATSDGKIYVRNNANWIPDPIQIDAPSDTNVYGRQHNSWVAVTGGTGGGGITDAPLDGNVYARQNGAWVIPKVGVTYVYPGIPPASQVINVPIVFGINVPANLTGTQVYASSPPGSAATFTLNKISGGVTTAIGTITINSGSHVASSMSGSGGTLAPGDVLQMVAPAVSPTLADIDLNVLVART